MEPVNPVRLSRIYEDVDWVEKSRPTRRGKKRKDEYLPSKGRTDEAPGKGSEEDVFESSNGRE